jgi:hypothetical protein
MKSPLRLRRLVALAVSLLAFGAVVVLHPDFQQSVPHSLEQSQTAGTGALQALETLEVKGRAPKTGYERSQFGDGWTTVNGCDTRNIILNRDLSEVQLNEKCQVLSGVLHDPYTASTISFKRGADTSDDVQIDHVVALSDAWQKGAQLLDSATREALANDPLELIAVEGRANQQKSDGDAATWLPTNKAFRCQYVARQIAVKQKYKLWVTGAEKDAIARVLDTCPSQPLPS